MLLRHNDSAVYMSLLTKVPTCIMLLLYFYSFSLKWKLLFVVFKSLSPKVSWTKRLILLFRIKYQTRCYFPVPPYVWFTLFFFLPGTMIPESGGMYSYMYRAFGPVPAFLYMWVTTLTRNSAGTAVVAITFANYFIQLLLPHCEAAPAIPARFFAAALIGVFMDI